jgi:ribulose-phosphate 3-epimerase
MSKIKTAPSILAADFTHLGEEILAVTPQADQLHVDVMDGRFVPNITMGPLVVAAMRRVTALPLDVHLMIVEPEKHLEAFAQAGATMLTIHQEVSPNLHRTLQAIRDLGLKAGVAINPHTPAASLSEILHLVDIVLVMTVNPGFGGQRFLVETLPKIRQVRQMVGTRELDISVDGGIGPETAAAVIQAGANVLVAGSSVFQAVGGPSAGLTALHAAIQKAQTQQI